MKRKPCNTGHRMIKSILITSKKFCQANTCLGSKRQRIQTYLVQEYLLCLVTCLPQPDCSSRLNQSMNRDWKVEKLEKSSLKEIESKKLKLHLKAKDFSWTLYHIPLTFAIYLIIWHLGGSNRVIYPDFINIQGLLQK